MGVYAVDKLISETRRLAAEYRRATGKALPVTGEIAIYDAKHLLSLEVAPAHAVGYDAVGQREDSEIHYQVKGRVIFEGQKSTQRLGQLKLTQAWDVVLLVLLDEDYEATEIYGAGRDEIQAAVEDTQGSKRGSRGALSVARFKIIGRRVWCRELGLAGDSLSEPA